MIRSIRGTLIKKEEGYVLIDVNGICFGLETPTHLAGELPDENSDVRVHTLLHFTEDGFSLFGFATEHQRDIFELLISTSGIGPRMGLAILSAMPVDEFIQAVMEQNIPTLTRIPGIGRKKAERIIVELKDKISLYTTGIEGVTKEHEAEITDAQRMRINDAIEALISLGMKPNDATKAIYTAFKELGSNTTTTDLIKLGLKYK